MNFQIDGENFTKLLSKFNVSVAHTYLDEIKRTQTGKVASFPISYRTVGINVMLQGKVYDLVRALNLVQKDKVTLNFTETVYTCTNGKFSCTNAEIERIQDAKDKLGNMTISFVSVGIPSLLPDATTETVAIVAPDNV